MQASEGIKSNRLCIWQQASPLVLFRMSSKGWISEESRIEMEEEHHLIDCKAVYEMFRHLQRQVTANFLNDPENWWVKIAEGMEVAAASETQYFGRPT